MPRIGGQIFVALVMVATTGCRRPASVSFTTWTQSSEKTVTENQAFQHLIMAGQEVAARAQGAVKVDSKGRPSTPLTSRTVFFPKQRDEARAIIGNSRETALSAARDSITYNYQPIGLGQPPAALSGLRLIGLSVIWDLEDAVTNRDFDSAILRCAEATRLGFALMGGGANEASLGASMINQSRQKMLPVMGALSAGQLGKLGLLILKASANRPPMQVSVENERDNMLLGLQQVQDAFVNHKLDGLQEKMGSSSKDVIDQLKGLEDEPQKAKEVFDWLGNDISNRSDWFLKMVKMPKKVGLKPALEDKKQYRMLYRYLATNMDSLVPLLQVTYCRTQLLILDCFLKQKIKRQLPLPANLTVFSRSAILDPFTGDPFYYHSGSSTYLLYSAGADGMDNGGQTDTSFMIPDVLLEQPESRH